MSNDMTLEKVVASLEGSVDMTWQAIGPDFMEMVEELNEQIENDEVIEACLDANRLAMFASQEADELASAAIKKFGYKEVMKSLSKTLRLV